MQSLKVVTPASRKPFNISGAGRILMTMGLAFVGLRLWDYRHSLVGQVANPTVLLATLLLAIIYGCSGFLLAFGWWLILRGGEKRSAGLRWKVAWPIYGKTQIAKYIPGNIFHFAGRHVLAAKQGVSHSLLVAAATIEIVMLLLASGFISLLAVEDLSLAKLQIKPDEARLALMAFVCVAVATLIVAFRRSAMQKLIVSIQWQPLFVAQLCYFLFSILSAVLFFGLTSITTGTLDQTVAHWRLIVGGYSFAWAGGLLAPGAPAGLGVREAILIALLSRALHEQPVLIAAVLFRLVTTLGDNLFFLQAILFGLLQRTTPENNEI